MFKTSFTKPLTPQTAGVILTLRNGLSELLGPDWTITIDTRMMHLNCRNKNASIVIELSQIYMDSEGTGEVTISLNRQDLTHTYKMLYLRWSPSKESLDSILRSGGFK